MSEWKAKRFWKEASVVPEGQGFTVHLDGRAVKTPAKQPLVVPCEPLAQKIAEEWNALDKAIDPARMPFTRSANAAIDKVAVQHGEVAAMIAGYGDSDLLCYRAEFPAELVARQNDLWTPLLDWARNAQGIELKPITGIVHQPQSATSLTRISDITTSMSVFELTAFHDLVSLSGSFVLGLAAAQQVRPIEEIWTLSRLDETWQEEQWGADDEATALAATKRSAFLHAATLFRLVADA
ncbi:ATPase [Rhodobacteraceae bacterium D3-12]|nr:ATPase [Rhodobacteraceae bacterium D3-12]